MCVSSSSFLGAFCLTVFSCIRPRRGDSRVSVLVEVSLFLCWSSVSDSIICTRKCWFVVFVSIYLMPGDEGWFPRLSDGRRWVPFPRFISPSHTHVDYLSDSLAGLCLSFACWTDVGRHGDFSVVLIRMFIWRLGQVCSPFLRILWSRLIVLGLYINPVSTCLDLYP